MRAFSRDLQAAILDCLLHNCAALLIGFAHPFDQGIVMPKAQKIGRGALNMTGGMAQHTGAQRAGFFDKGG